MSTLSNPAKKVTSKLARPSFCRVLCGEAHRAAEDRIVRPDPVLQEQREETDREGQVETGFPTGETGIDGAEVTLEKQRLRIEVELIAELPIAVSAAELEAGELLILLNRREEGVYAFGAGDLEVDVEVQPGRDLGNILAVVAVVGDRRPPVAVDGEAREQRIQIHRRECCSRRISRRCIAGGLAQQAGAAARPRSSRRRCRPAPWHRSSCHTAGRVGKGRPCRPACCGVLAAGLRCRQSSFWRTRLRTADRLDFRRDRPVRLGRTWVDQPPLPTSVLLWPAAGTAVVPDITR